jgi:glycosyltransferase involved in cell wall biosynthesis
MNEAVSVIIPCFNRKAMLERAIASVLCQDFKNFELVVVDDGSNEDLGQIEKMLRRRGQRLMRLEKNSGVSVARNQGVKISSAPLICFLDSDDLWLPQKLRRQIEFRHSKKNCRLLQCQEIWYRSGIRVNQKKKHCMPDGEAFFNSLKLCCISPSAVMIERDLFDRLGGFDERLRVCEDYDLWLRATSFNRCELLKENLVIKHAGHSDQISRSLPAMDRFRLFAILKLLNSNTLSEHQRRVTLEELINRVDILYQGACKRGHSESSFYLRLKDMASIAYSQACPQN